MIILLGIIVGIGGAIFVQKLFKDREVTNKRIIEIGNLYKNMNQYISEYNSNRSSLKTIIKDVYIDNFNSKYQNVLTLLKKEEESLKNTRHAVLKLDKDCNGRMYSDSYVNQVCISYKSNYEEMVNVFAGDVHYINSMISNYNNHHNEKLEEYSSSDFKDYIDYNRDGVYSGKEDT